MSSSNIADRLWLCWGHLDNWRKLPIVQQSEEWLNRANAVFTPTSFIAYKNRTPVGMIEFLPQEFLRQLSLCPCRIDREQGETESRYDLGREFDDYLLISCLSVARHYQGKGIGIALLNHLLESEVFKGSKGALVYVRERDQSWEKFIHWPAGPKEFYFKAGFSIARVLENPPGCILRCKKTSGKFLSFEDKGKVEEPSPIER
jgi:GNAT superfamily N-acetyltransferase